MEKGREIKIKIRGIIFHEGKLLTVRHPHDTSFAALPGGHLEWGEDLKEGLSREIIEELGVKPDIGRLLYINTFIQIDKKHYEEFFFEIKNGGDYLHTEKLSKSHAFEIAEVVWVSPTDNIRILPQSFGGDFKTGKIFSNEVKYIKDA